MKIPFRVKMCFNRLIYNYFLVALSFISCNAASLNAREEADLPFNVKQLDKIFPEIVNTTTALIETHGTNGKEVKNEEVKILSNPNLRIGAKSSNGSEFKDGSLTLRDLLNSSHPVRVTSDKNKEEILSKSYAMERTGQIHEMVDRSNGKWDETKPSTRTPATISSLSFSGEQKMPEIPSKSIPLEEIGAGLIKVVEKGDETKSSTPASSDGSHNPGLIMRTEEKAIKILSKCAPTKITSEDAIMGKGKEDKTEVSTPISYVAAHNSSMEFRTIEKTDRVSFKSAQIPADVATVIANEEEINTSTAPSSVNSHNQSIALTTKVKGDELLSLNLPSKTNNEGNVTVNGEENKAASIPAFSASAHNLSKEFRTEEKANIKSAPLDKTNEDLITVNGKENETISSTSAHFISTHDQSLMVHRNLGKEARERLSTSFSTSNPDTTMETKEKEDEIRSLSNQSHSIHHVGNPPDVTAPSTPEPNDSTSVPKLMSRADGGEHHESSSTVVTSHGTGNPQMAHNHEVKVIDDKHKNANKSGGKETRQGTEDLKIEPKTHFKDNSSIGFSGLSYGSLNINFASKQDKASQLKSNTSEGTSVKESVTPGGKKTKTRSKREDGSKNITIDEVISEISMNMNISMKNQNVSQILVGKMIRSGNYGGLLIEKMLMRIQKPQEEQSLENNSKEDSIKIDNLFLKMWAYDNENYHRSNIISRVPGFASNLVSDIFKRMVINERHQK